MLDEIGVLYRGLVLGLVIAAPVGPVGLLCIRRTLQKGMVIGLATGLGAACADVIYGAIAVLGISAILGFIHHYQATIQIIGGIIVLATARHTWSDHPKPPERCEPDLPTLPELEFVNKVLEKRQDNLVMKFIRSMLSGFIITVTNPLTLFGTLAVVATFGAVTDTQDRDVLIAGIFAGSCLWWFLLSSGVGFLLRKHFTESRIITVNRITAIALATLAAWAIFNGLLGYVR